MTNFSKFKTSSDILLTQSTTALPENCLDFINIDEGENLEFNISDMLFLDILPCQLRGPIIDSNKRFKKRNDWENNI